MAALELEVDRPQLLFKQIGQFQNDAASASLHYFPIVLNWEQFIYSYWHVTHSSEKILFNIVFIECMNLTIIFGQRKQLILLI